MIAAIRQAEPFTVSQRRGSLTFDARCAGGAIIGGLLIAAIEFAITRRSVSFAPAEQLVWLARLSVHWTLAALPLGWLVGQLERRSIRPVPSRLAYAAVVVLGAVAGATITALHGKYVDPSITATAVGFDMALADRFLYGFWQLGFWGVIGAALHAADLRHRHSVAALQEVEFAALRSERALAETQLAALHAQVEPEFIVATLDTVEHVYARDIESADRVLDALILFLREATPLLRRESSTVERECRLLDIYSHALGAASGSADRVSLDIATDAHDVPLPPGILVSIATGILDACFTRTAEFEVRAYRGGDGLEVDLIATAKLIRHTQSLRDCIARAERRLKHGHGPASSITVGCEESRRIKLRLHASTRENQHVASQGS